MRAPIDYDDFAVHFEADAARPGCYRTWQLPVTAKSAPSSFDATPFALGGRQPGSRQACAERSRDARRAFDSQAIDDEKLGGRLFDALFRENLGDAFEIATRAAEDARRGLRLRLVVDPALGEPALRLLALPWELLFDRRREETLGVNLRRAIVRHLRNPCRPPERQDPLEGALRVLTVAPAPRDLERLDQAGERGELAGALARRGRLELHALTPPTLENLRRGLRDFDPHVVHFSGHGVFSETRGAALCFENAEGDRDEVPASTFSETLEGAWSLRLALLNACDTGRLPSAAAPAETALALLRSVPAVVAMRQRISDRAAIAFAGAFYDAVAAGDPLEAATAEGRRAIRNEARTAEDSIPALFLRREDGQVFSRIERSELLPWLRPQDDLLRELTQRFVGRSFIFERIDAFLANPEKRGYFLLRGDPGIGKSAFLAEWVRRTGAIYHFNVRNDGRSNRSRHFLGNLCAQLILRYQLPYPTLPDDATTGPRFLDQLLREVAEKCLADGEKLLVAVDALDEAVDDETEHGDNLLFLPPRLPENVFFVLTSRRPPRNERAPRLRFDVPLEEFDLDHDSSENRADVRAFVELNDERHPAAALESWWQARRLDRPSFVDLMTERSDGNFRYLFHVLPEIARGTYREGVDSLPAGLRSYYDDHWRRLRELCGEDWRKHQIPVLGAMSVVHRPLELELIRYLTDIEDGAEVLAVLLSWEAFLHVRRHPSGKILLQTYRFYHGTFIDFVESQPEVDLAASERRMSDRLREDFERLDAPRRATA